MECKVTYFEDIRPENTDVTFGLVNAHLKDSGSVQDRDFPGP